MKKYGRYFLPQKCAVKCVNIPWFCVFAYLYLHFCKCVIVLVYLYLCICICVQCAVNCVNTPGALWLSSIYGASRPRRETRENHRTKKYILRDYALIVFSFFGHFLSLSIRYYCLLCPAPKKVV